MVKVNGTWGGAPCGKFSVLFFPFRSPFLHHATDNTFRKPQTIHGKVVCTYGGGGERGKGWECQLARSSVIVRERWGETCVSGWQRRRTGRNMFGRGMEVGQDGQNRTKAERYIPYRGLGKPGGIGRTQYSSDAQAGRCVVGAFWKMYRGWR